MKKLALFSAVILLLSITSIVYAEEYGVYLKVAEKIEGGFDNAVRNIEDALKKNDWQILASYSAAVPEGCKFRAHNIVFHSAKYDKQIMGHGNKSVLALPLRVGIYEDESGINAAFVNPASINRTVLGDNIETELSISVMNKLSDIIGSALKGSIVKKQIGQLRTKGKIGGMGGGDFVKMVDEIYKVNDSGSAFQDVANKVKEGIFQNKKDWKLIYTLELGEQNVILYGINKPKTEARAYGIAGDKRSSKSYAFPGIDHVAAFPIEVVVYKESGMVKVATLDEMYRMKLYFEDAGNWAFMKNMKMPGDIKDEIVEISISKLK